MSARLREFLTIARHELHIVRIDPFPVVVLVGMPLVALVFVTPAFARIPGNGPSGAVQSVPVVSVGFAFFVVAFVGIALFREHGWGTWQRLRASPVRPLPLMLGKTATPFAIVLLQHAVLFGFGIAFLGLTIRGSALAAALVAVSLGLCLIALGMALGAFMATVQQLNTAVNLGAVVCAGLGGALTPIQTLPGWAQAIAPVTPTYWAIRGYHDVIFHPGPNVDALVSAAVLCGFAAVFTVLFAVRFRFDEKKLSWA